MNDWDKAVAKSQLDDEKAAIKALEKHYRDALHDIEVNIKILSADTSTQSRIYQLQYQKAMRDQISAILQQLHTNSFTTIEKYLETCYQNGFVGTMYSIAKQGMPIIVPINQDAVIRAAMTNSKLSAPLYESIGMDMKQLKKTVTNEITRGIANGSTWDEISNGIEFNAGIPRRRAQTIARTEGHRVQQEAAADARNEAKARGCDVVKQWDSTLDGNTRPSHRQLDGQIRETNEPFEIGTKKADQPGAFGDPAEDCNCRCVALTRARWGLDEDELKTLQERAEYFGLDKNDSFEEYKVKYLGISEKDDSQKTGSVEKIQVQMQDKEAEIQKMKDELWKKEIDLKYGKYQEEIIRSNYSDVMDLDEKQIKELKESVSKLDKLNKRLNEVSDEYYDDTKKPNRREEPELYAAWKERHKQLSEEMESLYKQIDEVYSSKVKYDKYLKYVDEVKRMKENGTLSYAELVDTIDSLKTSLKNAKEEYEIYEKRIKEHPEYYDKIYKTEARKELEELGVKYRPIKKYETQPSSDDIIARLGGGDKTEGSCASLSFAYVGNRHGYDVLDFRDGESRRVFSHRCRQISQMDGVTTVIEKGYNDQKNAKKLLTGMQQGKEYILVTGHHAAVVRKNADGVLQYLELQSGREIGSMYGNGWTDFTIAGSIEDTLKWRFASTKSRSIAGSKYEQTSYLIDSDSLKGNKEFERLLGYINTPETEQRKGSSGTIK